MAPAKNRSAQPKTIMGIDPGTNYTGYGILEIRGRETRCVVLGYIELNNVADTYQKLRIIFERVSALIEEYRPDEVALESPFFGENVQSMLKLGRAQGVAMAAALTRGLPVFEYAPRRIKQAITGNGGASKEQVAAMLGAMLGVEYSLKKLDATDGLAVALCHHFESSSAARFGGDATGKRAGKLKTTGKSKSWESYLASNPEREIRQGKAGGKTGNGAAVDGAGKVGAGTAKTTRTTRTVKTARTVKPATKPATKK